MSSQNQKTVEIFVNTASIQAEKRQYNYSEIVEFAYPGQGGQSIYLVKYTDNDNSKNSKMLKPGDSIMLHEGMSFRVTSTGES